MENSFQTLKMLVGTFWRFMKVQTRNLTVKSVEQNTPDFDILENTWFAVIHNLVFSFVVKNENKPRIIFYICNKMYIALVMFFKLQHDIIVALLKKSCFFPICPLHFKIVSYGSLVCLALLCLFWKLELMDLQSCLNS